MNSQLPPITTPFSADYINFAELIQLFSRLRWQILAITGLFTALGVLVAFSTEPVYRGGSTLLIEAHATRAIQQVQEVYDPGFPSDEYFETQTELLRSRDLIGRVVDQLKLATNTDIVPPAEASLWNSIVSGSWLPFVSEASPAAEPSALERRENAIDAVLKHTEISTVYKTQLRRISFDAHSPQLAANVTNAIADAFMSSSLESRLDATERATHWLTDRLGDLRTKLEASEEALQKYRDAHKLVNVGGSRGLFEQDVVENARKLREAQAKKTELASTYWKIQQAGDDPSKLQDISTLLLDPNVQKAGENMLIAQQAVKQLEDRYGAKHPQMITAQARLQGAQQQYNNQLRLAANGIKAEYEISAETERALTSIVQSGKDQIRKLDQRDYEMQSLEREVQTNRELYDLFLKRYKENDSTSTYEPVTARIIDRATVPLLPYKPNKPKVTALWALAGLMLALVLATLRHLLSDSIRSPDQLEQLTQLPVLSVLPPVAGMGRKISATELCVNHPRDAFPEGVRTIRASLHLSDVDKRMKKVMFTSAMPQEGKSSISSSFAAVLGHNEKVVLIEADLRAPTLKKIFGIPKEAPGLVELLTGQAKIDDAIFVDPHSGAHVLPVAQVPANPAEVIGSAAFHKLIDVLASRYERLVFDAPPCGVASDSLLLGQRMDAVVFVIHGGTTGIRVIQAALKHLRNAQAPLLGHVLNQVNPRRAYGHDGSYYVYGEYGR